MVQVLEDGAYQITFYASGGSPYSVFLNGAAVPESFGGTWNGAPGQYTQGQFVFYLAAGTIVSINAMDESLLIANEINAVCASLLIQRIAEISII
jgi:hypothetical protein